MSDIKEKRLSKIAREFNVGISTMIEFLKDKGIKMDLNPNTKISSDLYNMLIKEYSADISVKKESEKVDLDSFREIKETISINDISKEIKDEDANIEQETTINDHTSHIEKIAIEKPNIKVIGEINLDKLNPPKEIKKVEEKEIDKPIAEEEIENIPKSTIKAEELKIEEKPNKTIEKEIQGETKIETKQEDFIPTNHPKDVDVKVVGKIDLESMNQKTRPNKKTKKEKDEERKKSDKKKVNTVKNGKKSEGIEKSENPTLKENKVDKIETTVEKLSGITVVDKIKLAEKKNKTSNLDNKKKRKRILIENKKVDPSKNQNRDVKKTKDPHFVSKDRSKRRLHRPEVKEEDVQKQIKDTLARLTKTKSKGSKYRKDKREAVRHEAEENAILEEQEKNILKVTEFVSVNELANMMDVPVNLVIDTCMSLDLFVSINQRLDAETMSILADEFNFKVEFISVEVHEAINEQEDNPEDLLPRFPIVTVMGHVDHGKTKLLDYIRNTNVIAGEAGGITQHIGAYAVKLKNEKHITFLDTPGHEAFTAMRARGAQVTDIAIIVIAADDGIKPQTKEAINHAHAAGVPIIFAINKIDKPSANPEKVKEELANLNLLVEDWGGKIQSQDISAIKGTNVDELLEKVLLEAEMLDLKANPNRNASGTVIESALDKGKGFISTILVQKGAMKVGDILLAGQYHGRVKAMQNERGKSIKEAGPSMPVIVLGLNGAPQAGDTINVMDNEREVKEIATKRSQLQREQGLRSTKHITLDEIGRRIAIGNFQELNIIVKGDMDGSIEALSDSLIKLSTDEIQVNVIHKAVGQISESDILLAAASNAIIIGFQVRPSLSSRKLAEKEEIDIRLYSIIYDAINELKAAMEGMLSPDIKEVIIATLEIRETFKVTKIGTVAGCIVKDGKVTRNSLIRIIRDGVVVHTGELGSLKRFKDDVKEVASGYECGLNINNFNELKEGDIIEAYKEVEVKKTL